MIAVGPIKRSPRRTGRCVLRAPRAELLLAHESLPGGALGSGCAPRAAAGPALRADGLSRTPGRLRGGSQTPVLEGTHPHRYPQAAPAAPRAGEEPPEGSPLSSPAAASASSHPLTSPRVPQPVASFCFLSSTRYRLWSGSCLFNQGGGHRL